MTKAGERLREVRLEKGLTLEDVSKSTKIKISFLEHIEKGEYTKLPSVSYAQGFVRNYAKFLNLPEKEILALFRREFDSEKAYRVLPKGFEKEEISISKFKIKPALIIILFIILSLLSYVFFQYRGAFMNPSLEITSPDQTSLTSSTDILVSGKTDSNVNIFINDDVVSVSDNGNFEKKITLFPGKSVIIIKAVNKFSRETEKKIEVEISPSP